MEIQEGFVVIRKAIPSSHYDFASHPAAVFMDCPSNCCFLYYHPFGFTPPKKKKHVGGAFWMCIPTRVFNQKIEQ